MSGIKRKVLSYQMKREIIEELQNGAKNIDVCKKFGLPSSSVSTVWRFRNKILKVMEDVSPLVKRARRCTKSDVDSALMQWLKTEGQKVRINGPLLKAQAERLAVELGHDDFTCSNGWLYRFRFRHNITWGRVKPGENEIDPETEWLKMVWDDFLKVEYEDRDIYCVHETGIFYDATPSRVCDLKNERCLDGQLDDSRLTVLLCCNMSGTEKRPLVVIGSLDVPDNLNYYLKEKSVTYVCHPKAWMTEEIFEREMFLWDEELRQENRRILVLINTCSAHVRLNALENIQLCFLPRDAPGLQPIDRGVSQCLRHLYRRQLVLKIVDDIEIGSTSKIPAMDAVNMLHDSWELVFSDTVRRAFRYAGLTSSSASAQSELDPHLKLSSWLALQNKGVHIENLDEYELFDHGLATCAQDVFPKSAEEVDGPIFKELGLLKDENANGNEDDVPKNKLIKPNPCIGCLGMLQKPYSDTIIESIIEGVNISEYDAKTFNLSINLPSCCLLRSEALLVELRKHVPAFYEDNFKDQSLLSLKDAFKACFGHRLCDTFNLSLDLTSGFVIDVEFKYIDDSKECEPLCSLRPDVFTSSYVRKCGYTKNRIELVLKTLGNDEFSEAFNVPPTVPSDVIRIVKTTLARESVNVAGRYNKYCRDLPQTPWLLNGERKMESSVEEIISEPIVALLGGTTSKFASSGREDVDVRSLGRGRPFNVEVLMPKIASLPFERLRELEKEITEKSNGKLRVRDLQIVSRESLVTLKQGEEEKTKEYTALCICPNGIPETLEEAARRAPLILDQSTPLRVLHRRPVAVRQKKVLEMSVKRLEGDKKTFILTLRTQAGTYIKEFVHGDLGRTKPSFGDLLGGVAVDILALDVTDIALDWPPSVSNDEGNTNGVRPS